ncbi:hypothetical protein SAPIO_CDS1360 [Scedosporium apiospermum]|uniref:Nudix hydrolase domain-containing protein n=1 Tax=Pseudallescheria apiosperma TaxID=563466 RepID=A0A084GF54_PSEDA|nr:uncharacterized protein SAPIO_CDS1360 [Scedosporium apiospermum]KEZ45966.1 hypothetical protein SAPIO_CDS1360 [Scedosporium apiospermum]
MTTKPTSPSTTPHSPEVRISVLIHRRLESTFLVAKCTGTLGQFRAPGGYLEYGETFLAAAERLTRKETGLEVHARRVAAVDGEVMGGLGREKHYVTIFVVCELQDEGDEPELCQVVELEECEGWEWRTWDQLRSEQEREIDMPLANLLDQNPSGEMFLRRSL